MAKSADARKIWLVPHPTSQYNEDVKKLARRADLVIFDARFKDGLNPEMVVSGEDAPKLTLTDAAKAAKAAKSKVEKK